MSFKKRIANLHRNPSENTKFSTQQLKLAIEDAVNSAKSSGRWIYPYHDAATSLEEMTFDDMAYWLYKCTNPILEAEESKLLDQMLQNRDSNVLKLPDGFKINNSVTFGAAGDLLQADGLEFSKDILFDGISDILFDQDISFANFESPVTTQPLVKEVISDEAAPVECCNHHQFNILTSSRGKYFSVLNTANNHIFDMGLEGIKTTHKTLSVYNIMNIGTNENPDNYGQAQTIIKNDIKIGFATCTFGLNGHQLPEGENYRIHISRLLPKNDAPDLELIKNQIDYCKNQKCDFIIAPIHWGYEFEFFPREKQIQIAHELIEYGADAIISSHAHVIQPVEYYQTLRDPNRIALIAYSLGSLTWGYTNPQYVLSLIQNFSITKGIFEGKEIAYIENAMTTPVLRSVIEEMGHAVTKIEKLADHISGNICSHSKEYIAEIKKYSDLVLM